LRAALFLPAILDERPNNQPNTGPISIPTRKAKTTINEIGN
jgi:hypothetical protein